MKIQVIGLGCPTCKSLYEIVKKAVEEIGLKTEVEYLAGDQGLAKMMELGVMQSPILVVNEKVVMMGYINDVEKIKEAILKIKD